MNKFLSFYLELLFLEISKVIENFMFCRIENITAKVEIFFAHKFMFATKSF